MKKLLFTLLAILVLAAPAAAQMNPACTTTTSAAVNATVTVIPFTAVSCTISVNGQASTTRALQAGDGVYIDGEYMTVPSTYVSGVAVNVVRGQLGTTAKAHTAAATIVFGPPAVFSTTDPGAGSSSCSAGNTAPAVYPVQINVVSGTAWLCRQTSSTVKVWVGTNSRQITYNSLTVR